VTNRDSGFASEVEKNKPPFSSFVGFGVSTPKSWVFLSRQTGENGWRSVSFAKRAERVKRNETLCE
jgi:hypothetical protein